MERECEDEKHEGRKKFVEIVDRGGKRAGEDRTWSTARKLVVDHCCVTAVEHIGSIRNVSYENQPLGWAKFFLRTK